MIKSPTTKPKAIIMGVDRVITDVNTWFEFLTELRIDLEKHRRMYGALKDGKANWEDVKRELFPVLKGEEELVHKSQFDATIGQINISSDAIATIRELQEKGYLIGIVSGSIDLIVKSVAKRLGITDWYANSSLVFDDKGFWKDITYQDDEPMVKLHRVQEFMQKHNLKPEEVLVLGHSDADVELFKNFPSIAMGKTSPKLKDLAWEEIEYFPRILQILKKFE